MPPTDRWRYVRLDDGKANLAPRAVDAKWYRLGRYDSAIVSMNDGTSAALYQRDPVKFRELVRRTVEVHERLRREWPRLAEEYRAALGEVTSPEAKNSQHVSYNHGRASSRYLWIYLFLTYF